MSIVIYPPTLDWAWMKQRPQQLMTQLARLGHTVYFCNRTRSAPRVESVEPNLFVVHHHERIRRCYPGQPAALIRNAYDPSMKLHLQDEDAAARRVVSKRRQIGYVGAWAAWIDEGLIGQCSLLPGAEMTVIGPQFDRRHRPGAYGGKVRFLGLKRHEELRDYIQSFSVCIIPFRITPVTVAANPVKACEYLAAGKPVISTALPECRTMAPHVDVAASREEFIRKVAERLDEPGDGTARSSYALEHTWEHRAREIEAFLRSLPERKEKA